MPARTRIHSICMLPLLGAIALGVALLSPATAFGGSGGSAAPSPGATTPGSQQVGADGAVSLRTPTGAIVGRRVRLKGTAATAGAAVRIERLDPAQGWLVEGATTAGADGAFALAWKARKAGRFSLRAVVEDGDAHTAGASPAAVVTVHQATMATWFGPPYDTRTACGQLMTPRLQGVAHKTLPCGTLVSILYRGRAVTVPVVDRGPFRRGVSWDLTAATAKTLGFDGLETVGSLIVSRPAASRRG